MGVVQRLGMALLSATRLAPYAEQIIYPEYSREMQTRAMAEQELGKLTTARETEQRGNYYEGLESGRQEERRIAAEASQSRAQLSADKDKYDRQMAQFTALTKDRPVLPLDANQPGPTGWQPLSITHPDLPNMRFWAPSPIATVPKELLPYMPGTVEGQQVPADQLKQATAAYYKVLETQAKPVAPTAEAEKIKYQQVLAKMESVGEYPAAASTDLKAKAQAIRNSTVLTPEEKASAIAWQDANPTPASSITGMTVRSEILLKGMQERTPLTVIDSQNGQAISMNMEDFNQRNHESPGRYVISGTAVPAMQKQATFEDIQYNIDNSRAAIQQLGTMDAGTRAQLTNALAADTPEGLLSKVNTFLSGEVASTMTPQQRSAVIAIKNLMENALALRGIAGFGQGSDQLRNAIMSTLPNAKSADVPYMLEQIRQFEGIVQRLRKGVPGVGGPSRGATPEGGSGGPAGGTRPPLSQIFGR